MRFFTRADANKMFFQLDPSCQVSLTERLSAAPTLNAETSAVLAHVVFFDAGNGGLAAVVSDCQVVLS